MEAEFEEQLIERLREAYSMESSVCDVLGEMSTEAGAAEIRRTLEAHKREARHHRQRLAERLEAHGESMATTRASLFGDKRTNGSKGRLDGMPFTPRRFRRLLDGFSFASGNGDGHEPTELAQEGSLAVRLKLVSYDLLERTAERAGDRQTVAVARWNRAGEQALARTIASNPERFAKRLEGEDADS